MLLQKFMDLHAGTVPKNTLDLALVEDIAAIGIHEQGLKDCLRRILVFSHELRGKIIRDVESHSHRDRYTRRNAG